MWFRRENNDDALEAEEALKDAVQNLQAIKGRGREVRWISNALRDFREKNYIGEQVEDFILRGKG